MEKYIYYVKDIPGLNFRVKALLYQEEFEEFKIDIENKLDNV